MATARWARSHAILAGATDYAYVLDVQPWPEPTAPDAGEWGWLLEVQFHSKVIPDLQWPAGTQPLTPVPGDRVLIAFDPQDPEYDVVASADALRDERARRESAGAQPAPVSRVALWTLAGGLAGALLVLPATAVWAMRAPRRLPSYPPPSDWTAPG